MHTKTKILIDISHLSKTQPWQNLKKCANLRSQPGTCERHGNNHDNMLTYQNFVPLQFVSCNKWNFRVVESFSLTGKLSSHVDFYKGVPFHFGFYYSIDICRQTYSKNLLQCR